MPDSIPETGDVVIHSSGSLVTPSYAIRAVPGPDQFGCATREEAERMARLAWSPFRYQRRSPEEHRTR